MKTPTKVKLDHNQPSFHFWVDKQEYFVWGWPQEDKTEEIYYACLAIPQKKSNGDMGAYNVLTATLFAKTLEEMKKFLLEKFIPLVNKYLIDEHELDKKPAFAEETKEMSQTELFNYIVENSLEFNYNTNELELK